MTKKSTKAVCMLSSNILKWSFWALGLACALYLFFILQVVFYGSTVQRLNISMSDMRNKVAEIEATYLQKQQALSSLPIENYGLVKSDEPVYILLSGESFSFSGSSQ